MRPVLGEINHELCTPSIHLLTKPPTRPSHLLRESTVSDSVRSVGCIPHAHTAHVLSFCSSLPSHSVTTPENSRLPHDHERTPNACHLAGTVTSLACMMYVSASEHHIISLLLRNILTSGRLFAMRLLLLLQLRRKDGWVCFNKSPSG